MTPVKVTEQLIEKTKALRMKGKTQEAIAIELGITQGTVSRILRNNGLGGHLISRIRK
jgi:transcriptional regulator with XRE-family HTH domain